MKRERVTGESAEDEARRYAIIANNRQRTEMLLGQVGREAAEPVQRTGSVAHWVLSSEKGSESSGVNMVM